MAAPSDICPGCHREFTPRGYINHLRLTKDPRCTPIREQLQSHYPSAQDDDAAHPPLLMDVEMLDLDNTNTTTAPEELDLNRDTQDLDMDLGSTSEEAPNVAISIPDVHSPVVVDTDISDSDSDSDSDDDDDQGERPHVQSALGADPEHRDQAGMFFIY